MAGCDYEILGGPVDHPAIVGLPTNEFSVFVNGTSRFVRPSIRVPREKGARETTTVVQLEGAQEEEEEEALYILQAFS